MGVRDSRCGGDVADAAHRELVGTSGQAPVAAPSPAATTYIRVLQSARRWCRSGGNFLLGLAAEDEKSKKLTKRPSIRLHNLYIDGNSIRKPTSSSAKVAHRQLRDYDIDRNE